MCLAGPGRQKRGWITPILTAIAPTPRTAGNYGAAARLPNDAAFATAELRRGGREKTARRTTR
jgi:hypothetical protein